MNLIQNNQNLTFQEGIDFSLKNKTHFYILLFASGKKTIHLELRLKNNNNFLF